MANKKNRAFDQNIANLKLASMVVIMQQVTRSMEKDCVRSLPNGRPIVREQRVTGKVEILT